MAYGVLVDPEDKIVPSFTTVTADEWLTLLMLGVMGLVGFFALTRYRLFGNVSVIVTAMFSRSLQLIPPTTVAVLRAMEIVLAYGVQAVVLGEVSMVMSRVMSYFLHVQVPDSLALAGSSLVILSVVAFATENIFLSCRWGRVCGLH